MIQGRECAGTPISISKEVSVLSFNLNHSVAFWVEGLEQSVNTCLIPTRKHTPPAEQEQAHPHFNKEPPVVSATR